MKKRSGRMATPERQPDNGGQALCPFGIALEKITRHRLGLLTHQAVSDYLKDAGVEKSTSPASISAYSRGVTAPHANLVRQMLDAFEATDEEEELLYRAYWQTRWHR